MTMQKPALGLQVLPPAELFRKLTSLSTTYFTMAFSLELLIYFSYTILPFKPRKHHVYMCGRVYTQKMWPLDGINHTMYMGQCKQHLRSKMKIISISISPFLDFLPIQVTKALPQLYRRFSFLIYFKYSINNGYMYTYNRFTLLDSRNEHNYMPIKLIKIKIIPHETF